MKNSKKKSSFILLEVLIGIALVALFAIPLISFPIWQCKSELNSYKTLELERIANRIYAETLEELYLNKAKATWMDMEKQGAHNRIIFLKPEKILYDGKSEEIILRQYLWSTKCFDYKDSQNSLHFINIKIEMEASFLPITTEKYGKEKRIKIFHYKVLAKNIVQEN